jgi:adenylate kinase
MDLVFLGAPGAGKGTQAKRAAAALGVCHVSTGDLLREEVRAGSALGLEARRSMDRGQLVPDAVVDRMVEGRIASPACRTGFLLDGYPRNLQQARALDAVEERLGRSLTAAVLLDIPDAVVEERITARRSCPSCGAMFHLRSNPPRVAGKCDACGSELVVRSDDRPEVVRDRLAVYHRETEPILGHYRARSIVRSVDGTGTIEEVAAAVLRALGRA